MTSAEAADWLPCAHFGGDVVALARDLIGRALHVRGATELRATVIETEAYGGPSDPASHAAFRPGGRAVIMRGAPGLVYVYAAYGMYPCLNIVCGPEGEAAAVLVRGVWLDGQAKPVRGPGRVSRALGVGMQDQGETVCGARFSVSVAREAFAIEESARVGITRGVELPWRFVGREGGA